MAKAIKPIPLFGLALLMLLALAAIATSMPAAGQLLLSDHPIERHGFTDTQLVRKCLNDNGPMQVWYNPTTDRHAMLCEVFPSLFGMQIVQQDADGFWHEITAFIKDKMRTLIQVEKYLKNAGYVRIQ